MNLSSRENFIVASRYIILFTCVLSFLKGVRLPNIWSYTHFLFNYELGFSKRSFLGYFFQYFEVGYFSSYEFFVIFYFSIFLLSIVLLLRIIGDLVSKNNDLVILGSVCFFSSTAFVFLTHSIGYAEHFGLLVTLLVISARTFFLKYIAALFGSLLAILVHEAFLIIYVPIIFLAMLYASMGILWRHLLLAVYAASILSLAIYIANLTVSVEQMNSLIAILSAKTEVALREDAFLTLTRNGIDNLAIMANLWGSPSRLNRLLVSFAVVFPSVLFLITLNIHTLERPRKNLFMILSFLAIGSPLLLHVVAWDTERFNNLLVLTAFLMLLVNINHVYSLDYSVLSLNPKALMFGLFTIMLNFSSTVTLFDGYDVKFYPFIEHMEYLRGLWEGEYELFNPPKL